MTVYEVTVSVAAHLVADYEKYMVEQHIADVLATGYFVSAEMSRAGDKYRVRYSAETRDLVDGYLASDTERLRADFAAHFPDGVTVTREIWDVIAELRRTV
jgi:hypothetical protein